jgi:dUTPase
MKLKLHSKTEEEKNKPHLNILVNKLVKDGIEYERLIIKPHETVIVTTELITTDRNELGMLFSSKDFFDRGLLLIMPQLVQPGYDGCLSAIVVNYSNADVELRKEDKIFQNLVFTELSDDKIADFPSQPISKDDYLKSVVEKSKNLPSTFLSTGAFSAILDEKIRRDYAGYFTKQILAGGGVIAIVLSISVFILEYNADRRVSNYVESYHNIDKLQTNNIDSLDYKKLIDRINTIEKQLNKTNG